MRKKLLIVGAFLALALSSCHQKEIDQLHSQLDSLQDAKDMIDKQYKEQDQLIAEVQSNFTAIKETELGIADEAQSSEGVNPDKKAQIQENFKLLQDKMEENKQKIADLESKLDQSNGRFAALKSTIANLKRQQAESEKTITDLKDQLEKKNIEIKDLGDKITRLNSSRDSLNSVSAAQAAKMKEQDEAMHTVYYIIGTKKELKAKGLKEGALKSADVDKNICTKIDMRNFEANEGMDLKTTKAVIYTSHPASSYSIANKSAKDKDKIFTIKDWKSFWSNSKILVIQIK